MVLLYLGCDNDHIPGVLPRQGHRGIFDKWKTYWLLDCALQLDS